MMDDLFELEEAQVLIEKMWESDSIKFRIAGKDRISEEDRGRIRIKCDSLKTHSEENRCTILLRGEQKATLRKKLNSNDPVFELLFYFGDKAKKFYRKPRKGKSAVYSLFDRLSELNPFFKEEKSRSIFQSVLEEFPDLKLYYQIMLHREYSSDSSNLLSSTSSPNTARHDGNSDKVVILFWMMSTGNWNSTSGNPGLFSLNNQELLELGMLADSKGLIDLKAGKYAEENETTLILGCLPSYIFCAYDFEKEEVVFNPEILDFNPNWISDGFPIDQSDFDDLIKKTNYKGYFSVHYDASYQESWIHE